MKLQSLVGFAIAVWFAVLLLGEAKREDGRPKLLQHKEYFNPADETFIDNRDTYAPLVWQCRYSGIEVPDQLWTYAVGGAGKVYSDNQAEDMFNDNEFMVTFDEWVTHFATFVQSKGKVPPGKYRAFGVKRGSPFIKEIPLAWREIRMRTGNPPPGSSPEKQQTLGINKDVTLFPKGSESKRYYKRKKDD